MRKPRRKPGRKRKDYRGGVALTRDEAGDLLDALLRFKQMVDFKTSEEWSAVEIQIAALLQAPRIPHGEQRLKRRRR